MNTFALPFSSQSSISSFIINWQDLDRTRVTSGRIELDGKDYGGTILQKALLVDEIEKSSVCPFHLVNHEIDDISCCIRVDDKPLDEYQPELSDDGKTCSAWIPCQAGQIQIGSARRLQMSLSTACLAANVCYAHPGWDDFTRSYVRVSPTETRSLQFGVLELTHDELYANNDKDRRIGEITISVWLGRVTGSEPCRGGIQVPESSRVHEKTEKGLAHSVNFDILRANGIVTQPGSNTATVSQLSGSASRPGDLSPAAGKKRKASEDLGAERHLKGEVVDIEEIERDREAVRQAAEALRKARLRLYSGRETSG
ncbi:hypothetical protein FB107DRAFT_246874 [Schizophyllum commune]